jgi:hypothetical protein
VFGIGPADVSFTVTDTIPFPNSRVQFGNVTQLESVNQDPKLSHIDNFKYLPPLTKIDDMSIDVTDVQRTKAFRLGHYAPLAGMSELGFDDLVDVFQSYEQMGNCKTVRFDPTSHDNRIIAQCFEISKNDMAKLTVIDFGQHFTDDPVLGRKRVFFVGKMLLDDNGVHTFIHIFSMVFE